MERWMAGICLAAVFVSGACASKRAEERAMVTEEIEAGAGDEASLVGDGRNQMDGWNPPSDEIDADANPR